MAEPETIASFLNDTLFLTRDLAGKKVLVTAGPTYESMDPVRFIGNHSSGKMGLAISEELASRGAEVFLVLGPSSLTTAHSNIKVHRVQSADEMYEACIHNFERMDVAILSAAVADYKPAHLANEKIKKKESTLTLELVKTKDILKTMGAEKRPGQLLVGFALETNNEREYALNKLTSKNADIIVLNSLNDEGAGFGHDTNKVTIYEKDGNEITFDRKPKQQVARDIVDRIVKMLYA